MPGLTENVANCAIWRLRGSLGENTVFFCFFFVESNFQAILMVQTTLYCSIHVGKTFKTADN